MTTTTLPQLPDVTPRPDLGPPRRWHAVSLAETIAAEGTDAISGLSGAEASSRLARHGQNALSEGTPRSLVSTFLHQFRSPLIYLLLVAAAVAFALGHTRDAVVVFVVLLLNATIGSFHESRAERALEALRSLSSQRARVVRDGRDAIIDARMVVPGDVVLLESGDAVAADARLAEVATLRIAEAALTGESLPVEKDLRVLGEDTPLADRTNMVYAGTHVTGGRARAVVIATGATTEIGRIAALAQRAAKPKTPLELRVARFGRYIVVAAAVLFGLVISVGYVRGVSLDQMLMVGIGQVVSMVPEGLPVAMTIALAVGVQRMASRRAVIRQLSAVETLGSTTIICSDKTGTLTRNEMTVTSLLVPPDRLLSVSGAGWEPTGTFTDGESRIDPLADPDVRLLLEAGALCNDSQLREPDAEDARWRPIGDPTEVALLSLAMKGGLAPLELRRRSPRAGELPFDAAARLMATQHDTPAGKRVIIKGAPEAVLDLCGPPPAGTGHEALRRAADKMAGDALRVLAVAIVESGTVDPEAGFGAFRGHARFVGLLGQIDPPRAEVQASVARCRDAGIRPVMVTGDHKVTGWAVARTLGIARPGDVAIDGRELERMSDVELADRIDTISVFARVHPEQKLRIVDAYQRRGEVVAMTGDGVNDAPALVKADVGVAMGASGTEVAKESAKIIIGDDNFATIVAAVEEGRVVYRNLKKLILYLFATSMAEVVVLIAALSLGYPPPLAAVQILWINLVTDGVMSITLIMEQAEGDEMQQRPVPRSEPILTPTLLTRAGLMVPAMAASTLGWFIYRIEAGISFAQVQTETFTVLAVCQWFNVLNCRSAIRSAIHSSLRANRWLLAGLIAANVLQAAVVFIEPFGAVFHTVPFSIVEVVAIGAVASLVLWVEELRKLFARRRLAAQAYA